MPSIVRDKYFRQLLRYTLMNRGLLTLTIVMGVAGFSLAFVYPWLIASAFDYVIIAKPRSGIVPTVPQRQHWLAVLIAIGCVTAILQAIVVYGRGHCTVWLGNRIVTQIRRDLFDHLQRLSLHFYSKERTGSIMSRLLHDVHAATGIIYGGIIVVGLDVIQLLIALALLLAISWKLTLACLIVLPCYALTFKVFNPFVRRASEKLHEHYCKISGNVQEQLAGIALVKTYAAEERESKRFEADVEEHHDYVVAQSHVGHLVGAFSELLVNLGTMIVVGYGGWLALQGQLTVGDVTKFLGYIGIMYGPVRRFAELNMVYQTSLSAMVRVFRVFDITPKIREKATAIQRPPQHGEVIFRNVRFHYADDSDETRLSLDRPDVVEEPPAAAYRWVLDGLNISVAPGERIALVGPSGAGKTTLVSLLPRLYDATDGKISIDGIDIRDYSLKSLRQSIGIVQQDSFVFSGSIRDNLIYGRPHATDEQVIAAAKAANAHEFIAALPDAYQTHLGERGVNLSGGQRQRLSIARAILKDPRILILDEATSALDTESERLVQDALDRLMRGRTCFIIAHRLSTVRNADRILVLRDGKIVEAGRHEELLDNNGLYARLCRQQFGRQPADSSALQPA